MKYELVHVGLNHSSEEEAARTVRTLCALFDLKPRMGNKSIFAGDYFECMKMSFYGAKGHIAMAVDDLEAAIADLEAKGIPLNYESLTRDKAGQPKNIYLHDEYFGFAFHVMQKG